MVYNFFSRWKELRSEVFSLKKEILNVEKVYRFKIIYFQRIWERLKRDEIDHQSTKKLLKLYRSGFFNPYVNILDKLKYIYNLSLLPAEEISQFEQLTFFLKEKGNEQKILAVEILDKLHSNALPEKGKIYRLQDYLKIESTYLQMEDSKFQELESLFLIKKNPGAGRKNYVQLTRAVQEGILTFNSGKLWIGAKPLQGVKIKGNKILIKGDHYSSLQNARWIEGDRFVGPSIQDPYSYFVERGRFSGWGQNEIQRDLGAGNAEAKVALEIEVFPEQVWIRIQPGVPTKFAIASLHPEQVIKVVERAALIVA